MALLFCDGFDNYGGATNMTKNGWFNIANCTFPEGRFHGKSISAVSCGLSVGAELSFGVFGIACKNLGPVDGPITFDFGSITGEMIKVTLLWSVGQIQIYEMLPATWEYTAHWSLVATSTPSRFPSSAWFFLEIKCDSATGVIVKIDGATALTHTHVLTGTLSSGIFSTITISTYGGGAGKFGLDDLYMLDGTTGVGINPMNDFIGDKRVLTLFPTANDSVQFTPVVAIQYLSDLVANHISLVYANTICLPQYSATLLGYEKTTRLDRASIIAKQDSILSLITLYSTTDEPTTHVRPVVYIEDPLNPDKPKALLAIGDETTGVFIGANPIQFGSVTVNLVKGVKYWLGFIADTNLYLSSNIGNEIGWSYRDATYPTVPSEYNWSSDVKGVLGALIMDYSVTATNYGMVSEVDADIISYNRSDTLGDKDLFSVTSSLSPYSSVYAVQVNGFFMKDDSGARAVANVVKVGSTESQGVDHNLNMDFRFCNDVWVQNPATSAEWTHSQIESMKIGYKITV